MSERPQYQKLTRQTFCRLLTISDPAHQQEPFQGFRGFAVLFPYSRGFAICPGSSYDITFEFFNFDKGYKIRI